MSKIKFWMLSIAVFLLLFTICSCGIRFPIKGRVLDAETDKPIEGAAVSLVWYDYALLPRLTGMGSGFECLAVYNSMTDADGYFETTYRLGGYYNLSVYKKGHICWNNKYLFDPSTAGVTPKTTDNELRYGMVIKLDRFKDHYPRYEHARFIEFDVISPYSGRIFLNAIAPESEIFYDGKK